MHIQFLNPPLTTGNSGFPGSANNSATPAEAFSLLLKQMLGALSEGTPEETTESETPTTGAEEVAPTEDAEISGTSVAGAAVVVQPVPAADADTGAEVAGAPATQAAVAAASPDPAEPETPAPPASTSGQTLKAAAVGSGLADTMPEGQDPAGDSDASPESKTALPKPDKLPVQIADRQLVLPPKEQKLEQLSKHAEAAIQQRITRSAGLPAPVSEVVESRATLQVATPPEVALSEPEPPQPTSGGANAGAPMRSETQLRALPQVPPETAGGQANGTTLDKLPELMVREVKLLQQTEGRTVTLRLHPASLGELQVEVVEQQGELAVRLVSASRNVRETLEVQLPLLREALQREATLPTQVVIASEPALNLSQRQQSQRGGAQAGEAGRRRNAVPGGSTEPINPGDSRHVTAGVREGSLNVFV